VEGARAYRKEGDPRWWAWWEPVLAAIVLMAVASLFNVKEPRRLWRVHRSEFFIAMAALLGVLSAGLLEGVLVGAVISLVLLIRRVSSSHVAFLGRIPGAAAIPMWSVTRAMSQYPAWSLSGSSQVSCISTLSISFDTMLAR
jgi:MFS superfamily sulfate permease-like transporter